MWQNGQKPVKKVAIYARCSTTDERQTVDVQLGELRRYCEAMGWQYGEFSEYDSGWTGEQPVLQDVLTRIKRQEFDCLLVYSLDRLSRKAPSYTNRLLDELTEQYGVRFISKLEGIDSANELTWNVVRPIFAHFSNLFSRNLSEKIRAGIRHKQQNGWKAGRKPKVVNVERLKKLRAEYQSYGYRRLATVYNEGLPSSQQVCFSLLRKVLLRLSFSVEHENGAISRC